MAEAMGTSLGVSDTMSAIASKLDRLVPFTTAALYLHDPTNGVSRCRFAAGPGHRAFPGLLVRDGEGLVGAAIATRECITNGDPAVDLGHAARRSGGSGTEVGAGLPADDGRHGQGRAGALPHGAARASPTSIAAS